MSTQFSTAELLKATKNFSTNMIIGNGDSFVLYKARLSNGKNRRREEAGPRCLPWKDRLHRAFARVNSHNYYRRQQGTCATGVQVGEPSSYPFRGCVFSFGIYMLEVATGRLPNLQLDLLDWVNKMLACYRYMELVDSKILRSELDVANVKVYFQIACLCASQNSQHRPDMGSVAALLNHLV
ncbi:hypothetical protein M0R45_033569 [Rubus argutus]|uniref:Uncharacterized protein n=1 Tax=Rubus argutus TaxID=59490 RepID=A0AAW1WMK9_RUBAR